MSRKQASGFERSHNYNIDSSKEKIPGPKRCKQGLLFDFKSGKTGI